MTKPNLEERVLGVLFGILSAVFVAGYITLNKYIYAHYNIDAIEYGLIFSVTGALFALGSLVLKLNKENRQLIKANYRSLTLLGFAGTMAVGTFTVGQEYTTVVNASLLMSATIVATAIFSHLFLKERHSKRQSLWVLLLFAGLYVGVVGFHSIQLRSGDLIAITASAFFGFGNAYSRVVMKRLGGAKLVPDVRLVIGGGIALVASLFVVDSLELVRQILPLALLAGLLYWLCMKTFARAVYLVNANNAIVLNNSQIFFSSLAGVLILSEEYSVEKLVGSVMAIVAIYFIAGKKR